MAKKILKGIGIGAAVFFAAVAVFLLFLTITEYRPNAVEALEIGGDGGSKIAEGQAFTIMTFNIGYGGLGKDQDFFMDGGSMVRPDAEEDVRQNLAGIKDIIMQNPADAYLLQEVDVHSKRSYFIDETAFLQDSNRAQSAFAYNFKAGYVPYPIPTIGEVASGLFTLSSMDISSAERISLPVPFKWPVSTVNLKRCLLPARLPLEESDKELVLVNLHLEAYDDGEGKKEQTKMLMDFLVSEYEKGNYVIAGGDFNQSFPDGLYPVIDEESWMPGMLDEGMLPDGWQFAYDNTVPTCRLLNRPYNGDSKTTQFYVIDGFILSPNVAFESVQTLDVQFEYADHQPVLLEAVLTPQA